MRSWLSNIGLGYDVPNRRYPDIPKFSFGLKSIGGLGCRPSVRAGPTAYKEFVGYFGSAISGEADTSGMANTLGVSHPSPSKPPTQIFTMAPGGAVSCKDRCNNFRWK